MIKTILIVDDSKSIISLLTREITREFHVQILKAYSLKEAIEYINSEKLIHVAILDLGLPDAPHGEVVDYALAKNIPSVVLTSTVDKNLQNTILKKDIIDYIKKDSPRSVKNIVNLISRTLKNYDTHILVVESSPMQLALTVAQLEKMKLNVSSATNGKEAFDMIKKDDSKFDLILTDYNMPIMDGMELTFKLRETYEKDQLGILVLSANSTPEVSTNFIKIGANDFINKPYESIEFKTRVNANLELIDLFKTKSLKEKEIYEQEKKDQILEIIGDIAHHWRQPLTSIAVSASGVKLHHDLGILKDEELLECMDKIEESTQFLSSTLDNFKRFIKDEGYYQNINIEDSMSNILEMIEMVFAGSAISLERHIRCGEDLNVNVIPIEFVQVIMNILNNANDVLLKNDIEDKTIKITTFKKGLNAVVTIEDNGGGIPKDIILKIFNPYFTTKHQSAGIGLGLHTAHKIITDNFNGKLSAENTVRGAKFTIELPLS